MVVIGLVGINMFLVKALADAKEVTVAELVAEPVRKAAKAVKGITRKISNKVVSSVKEVVNKGKAILDVALNKVSDAVDELKWNLQDKYYNLEARLVKRTGYYNGTEAYISSLEEDVKALERRVAILEARCHVAELGKDVAEQRLNKTLYCAKELKDKYERAEANIDFYIDEACEWQNCFERLTDSICDYVEKHHVAGNIIDITDAIIEKAFKPEETALDCKSYRVSIETNLLD